MTKDNQELIHYITEKLYNRYYELQLETDLLPETEFEAGFHMASTGYMKWLEELLSEIEVIG